MSKDKKKDVFDELVNNPTFIKEADDAWKNIDKLPSLCPHCNCMTKTIKDKCGKCGGTKKNTPYIEELKLILDENIGFFEGDKTLIQIKEAEIINWITKTIESEKEKAVEDFITKMYGKRCKGIGIGCVVCAMWELYDEYIK